MVSLLLLFLPARQSILNTWIPVFESWRPQSQVLLSISTLSSRTPSQNSRTPPHPALPVQMLVSLKLLKLNSDSGRSGVSPAPIPSATRDTRSQNSHIGPSEPNFPVPVTFPGLRDVPASRAPQLRARVALAAGGERSAAPVLPTCQHGTVCPRERSET